MSRVGSTITESDSKILNGLFNPYQWYTPTVKALPRFDDLINLGVGGKLQQGQQGIQQQAQFEQQNQQSFQQQMQPQQQVQFEQQDQSFQQQGLQQQMQPQQQSYQQQMQQPLQQQMQFEQKSYQQPLQQQVQQPLQQQMQQPLQQQMQFEQQYQQPLQQQVQFEQQKSFQQPLQQQMQQPLQQQMQFEQQYQQPLQQQMQQPLKQQMKFEQPQGVTQISEIPLGLQFSELPETVYFEISEFERKGGKGYEYKHKGKRSSRMVSVQQGNLNDWQMEAKNCIDKILQLNNKGYNRINQLENFRFNQGFSNQNDVNNWISRLKRNLDMLVKENERLRAELDSGNFGKMGGIQGGVNQGVMQGGVNLGKTFSESVDSSSVIRPSEIKKAHYSSEKIGQWHPQEKQSFTEKVKDTAFGIATTVENVALHPIDSVGKLATTVEQVALHPIQSVEKAADAVVHTVM